MLHNIYNRIYQKNTSERQVKQTTRLTRPHMHTKSHIDENREYIMISKCDSHYMQSTACIILCAG